MNKNEKLYEKLRKEYTAQELVESYVFPSEMTDEEMKSAVAEMQEIRFQKLKNRTDEERIMADLMRLRFVIQEYVEKSEFDENHNFGTFLTEYVQIFRKTKKAMAEDLNVHYTKFSRLLNDRDHPNVELTYRLEKHSDEIIPAILWWKLSMKKQEYLILKDKKKKKIEGAKVKNGLKSRA